MSNKRKRKVIVDDDEEDTDYKPSVIEVNDDDVDDFDTFFSSTTTTTRKSSKLKKSSTSSLSTTRAVSNSTNTKKRRKLSTTTTTTFPHMKLKLTPTKFKPIFNVDDDDEESTYISSQDDHTPTTTTTTAMNSGEMWAEKYEPKRKEDLSMNKDRVNEVDQFFQQFSTTTGGSSITHDVLILAGPPGSGKSSLIRSMCNSYGYSVKSFISDIDDHYTTTTTTTRSMSSDRSEFHVPYQSRLKSFEKFLESSQLNTLQFFRSNSPSTTTTTSSTTVHLVNELPLLTHGKKEKRSEVFEVLKTCCIHAKRRRNPIVLLHNVYDTPTILSNLSRNFPSEVLSATNVLLVQTKKFNKTQMRSILTRIISSEKRASVTMNSKSYDFRSNAQKENLDDIIEKSDGDLRQAITQLQFQSMRKGLEHTVNKKEAKRLIDRQFSNLQFTDVDDGEVVSKKMRGASRFDIVTQRKQSMKDKDDNITRDNTIDIYHAAARILYGKREKKSGRLEFDLETDVLRSVYANENIVVSYVHQNITQFCDSIEDLEQIMEHYSYGDTFCNRRLFQSGTDSNACRLNSDYQLESLSVYHFLISSYGTLYHNKHKPPNQFKHVYPPKLTKVFFDGRRRSDEIVHAFSDHLLKSSCDSRVLMEQIVPAHHLLFNICQNRRDFVNGTRVNNPTMQQRTIRLQRYQQYSLAQRSLLSKVHSFVFRGQQQQQQQQMNRRQLKSTEMDDELEAYGISEDEQVQVIAAPNNTQITELTEQQQQQEAVLAEDDINEFN